MNGERRRVAVLFADLSAYTALTARIGAEETGVIMTWLRGVASEVIAAHGGVVNQFVGDQVFALFGVVPGREDDCRRAILAALALHRAAAERDRPGTVDVAVQFHSAIHCGEVVLTAARDGGAGNVFGDAVNTGAKVLAHAGPDEILISGDVLREVGPYFETEPRDPIEIAGRDRPLAVHRVHRPTGVSSRLDAGQLTAFVGRERELALLDEHRQAAGGRGLQLLTIVGEAGIGKSRLIREYRARLGGAPWLHGWCDEIGDIGPYHAFACAVRDQLDLSALLASGGNPEQAQQAMFDALAGLCRSLAERAPLTVLLEDWHLADADSDDALAHLADALAGDPVMIVVNARDRSGGRWRERITAEIALGPFTLAETEIAARSVVDHPLSDDDVRALHERTTGNPLFVEEIARAIDQVAGAPLPVTVQAVLRSRLDQLAPAEAELLRRAAALGTEFSTARLQLIGGGDIDGALGGLLERRFLTVSHRAGLRFSHALVREVAYDSMLVRRRRALHAEIAAAIEATGDDADHEALAHHYQLADLPAREAVFAEKAGDRAAAAHALHLARAHYLAAMQALDRIERDPEQSRRLVDITLRWAACCIHAPTAEQPRWLVRACELARATGYTAGVARTLYWIGWINHALGRQNDALAYTQQCLDLVGDRDPRLHAQLVANIGLCHAVDTDYATAVEAIERSIQHRTGGKADLRGEGYAYAISQLGLAFADTGQFERARALHDEAIDLLQRIGRFASQGSVLGHRGASELIRGDWAACAVSARAVGEVGRRVRSQFLVGSGMMLHGCAAFLARGDGAAEVARAVDLLDAQDTRLFLSFAFARHAELLALTGDGEGARQWAGRALAQVAERERLGEVTAHRALGIAAATAAELDAHMTAAIAAADRKGARPDRAIALVRWAERLLVFDPNRSAELAARARDDFDALDMPSYRRLADDVEARARGV